MKRRHTQHDRTGRYCGDVGGHTPDDVTVTRPATLARQWQRELVELARRWEPYGGVPEEEIFVRFGISRPLFDTVLTEAANRVGTSRPPDVAVRHAPDSSL